MRAKGKVVQGLASCRGHWAYINSLSEKAKTELVADKAEEAELLQGRDPDTSEAQKIRFWSSLLSPDFLYT